MSPEYGEADIRLLCTKFGAGYRELKHDFREYRDTRGANIAPSIREMLNCVHTVPVSTASKTNVICGSLRTRRTVPHNSALMFVSLCGPPVHMCQPLKCVKSWLALNRRSADCFSKECCINCNWGSKFNVECYVTCELSMLLICSCNLCNLGC